MADMLSIGTLATNAFKRAIEVTSHNVANVGTEGYHRQRAELSNNSPQLVGNSFMGGGVKVSSVERIYSPYIQDQMVSANSMMNRYDQQLQLAQQLEGVVASNDAGVQEFLQRYFDSLHNVADNPNSSATRQLMLDETNNLHSHIQNVNVILQETQQQVNNEISDSVTEINSRLETVKKINEQVSRAFANGTQAPNDLLDQREQAIFELGNYLNITTFRMPDGEINIHTGNGKLPLVSGDSVTRLESGLSEFQGENRTEVFMNVSGVKVNISDSITGGNLGGILDFRSNMLDPALNEMGLMLNGFTAAANWQHYQGWDINGDPGQNLFKPLETNIIHSTQNDPTSDDGSQISVSFTPQYNNAGTWEEMTVFPPYDGTVDAEGRDHSQPVTYQDKLNYFNSATDLIGDFKPRDYVLRYSDAVGGFNVFDRSTNELLGQFTDGDTPPTIIDGLEFKVDVAGTYTDGDSFIVKPHQDMVTNFATELTDPDKIATRGQSPYDSATGADLDPATSAPEPAAIGDNVNIANMANLQNKNILYADANGVASETILGGYSKMSTNVGIYVRGTDIQLSAQTNVFQNIKDRSESLSGVNLDEEAANLLRFQQAYEASAQIIQSAQQMFQTLISAVRG